MNKKKLLSLLLAVTALVSMTVLFGSVYAANTADNTAQAQEELGYDREEMLASVPSGTTLSTWVLFGSSQKYYGTYDGFVSLWAGLEAMFTEQNDDTAYIFLTKATVYGNSSKNNASSGKTIDNCTLIFDMTGYTHAWTHSITNSIMWDHGSGTRNTIFVGGTFIFAKSIYTTGSYSTGATGTHNIKFYGTKFKSNGTTSDTNTTHNGAAIIDQNKSGFAGQLNITFENCIVDATAASVEFALVKSSSAQIDASKVNVAFDRTQIIATSLDTVNYSSGYATLSGLDTLTYKVGDIVYDYEKTASDSLGSYGKFVYDANTENPELMPFIILGSADNGATYTKIAYENCYYDALANSLADGTLYNKIAIIMRRDYTASSANGDNQFVNIAYWKTPVIVDFNGYTFKNETSADLAIIYLRRSLDLDVTFKNGTVILNNAGRMLSIKTHVSHPLATNATEAKVIIEDVDISSNSGAQLLTTDTLTLIDGSEGLPINIYINNSSFHANKSGVTTTIFDAEKITSDYPLTVTVNNFAVKSNGNSIEFANAWDNQNVTFSLSEVNLSSSAVIEKMALVLYSNIAPKFLVSVDAMFEEQGIIYNGKTYMGELVSVNGTDYYEVQLPQISPAKLRESLELTVIGIFNGQIINGATKIVNIQSYCENLVSNNSGGAANLAKAMLVYMGYTVSGYTGATNIPTFSELSPVSSTSYVTAVSLAPSLTQGFVITPIYTSSASNYTEYCLKLKLGDEEGWIKSSPDGTFCYASVPANLLCEDFKFQVYNSSKTTALSSEYTYSIYRYYIEQGEPVKFKAMMDYALEAKAYAEYKESENNNYQQAKDQWKELELGELDLNATHSSTYNSRVSSVSSKCASAYNLYLNYGPTFGKTVVNGTQYPQSNGTYDGCNASGDIMRTIYGYIYNMAKGYGTVGSSYYGNEDIAAAIADSLEYAYNNYYGVKNGKVYSPIYQWSQKEGTTNWWYRDIGIPLYLVPTLIIMEDYLGSGKAVRYISPFDLLNESVHMTGANRFWIGRSIIGSALLQEDSDRIIAAKEALLDVFVYVDQSDRTGLSGDAKTDGYYSDGSFIQHGKVPYTGGYGVSLIGMIADIKLVLNGTVFDFDDEEIAMHYDVIFDTYLPVCYEGNLFAAVCGRNITRSGYSESTSGLTISMIKIASYAPAEYKSRIEAFIRCNMDNVASSYATNSDLPLSLVDYTLEIQNSTSIAPVGFEGVKVFGMMDRIVQHGSNYGVCVALNSTRTYRYESSQDDNNYGWYQSDGAIYIYTDGYIYNNTYFNQSNPYKVPGTTVTEKEIAPTPAEMRTKGDSAFAGGVESADGKYAVTVYDLGSSASDYSKYNTNPPAYYNPNINAYKSYFLFDDEIVAVGSNISKGSDTYGDLNLYTTIENRLWRTGDTFSVNGSTKSVSGETTATARYMHFTNMGGYVFFEDTSVSYDKYVNTTSYLEIWIDHGTNGASNNKYTYVYLPEATSAETASYYSNPDVEILEQTDTIHVVRENTLGVTGYAFYASGTSNGVTVSSRCVVMIEENNGEYTVTISDPSHQLSSLNVTIDLSATLSSVVSKSDSASVSFNNGNATISLSISGNIGQTYTVTLK